LHVSVSSKHLIRNYFAGVPGAFFVSPILVRVNPSAASKIPAVFPFHHRMEDCGFQVLTAVYRFGRKLEFTE
jgi:hypothetical protein